MRFVGVGLRDQRHMAKRASVYEKFASLLEKRTLASAETPLAGGLVGLTLGAPCYIPHHDIGLSPTRGLSPELFAICLKSWSPADLFVFPINNVAFLVKF